MLQGRDVLQARPQKNFLGPCAFARSWETAHQTTCINAMLWFGAEPRVQLGASSLLVFLELVRYEFQCHT